MSETISQLDHLQLTLDCRVALCRTPTHLLGTLRASQIRQHTIQVTLSLRTIQATTVQAPTALRLITVQVTRDNQPTAQATRSLQSTRLMPMVLTHTTATATTNQTMGLLLEPAALVATRTFTTTTTVAAQDLVQDHRS
jgi:hypothetical protein